MKLQHCLPGRLTLIGSPGHSDFYGMCSRGYQVDFAHWDVCTRDQQKAPCKPGVPPASQKLDQFCGQVKLWHRAKRMSSWKRRAF